MDTPFLRPLLATEHGEFDAGAERLAFALAPADGAALAVVMPLLSNPEYEVHAPQLAARAEADAALRLRLLATLAHAAGVTLETQLRRGPEPYAEIIGEARRIGADLVVVRRRGRRGLLANLLVGDMVRNVVTHAPCSVLVVPREAQPWCRHVLVALDPQAADMTPVATAAAVAARAALPLSVLCITDTTADAAARAEQALQRARSTAHALGVQAQVLSRHGRQHEQIVAAAKDLGADLLVIGRRGDDRLRHAWLGGVAQKVIGQADGPVLVSVTPHATPTVTP